MQIKNDATVSSSPLLILSAVCMIGFFILLISMFASTVDFLLPSSDLFLKIVSY